jgi:hypothetical protein
MAGKGKPPPPPPVTSEPPPRFWHAFTGHGAASGSWTRDEGSAFYSCASNASPGALMAYAVPGGKKVFFGGWRNTAGGVETYANTTVCD